MLFAESHMACKHFMWGTLGLTFFLQEYMEFLYFAAQLIIYKQKRGSVVVGLL